MRLLRSGHHAKPMRPCETLLKGVGSPVGSPSRSIFCRCKRRLAAYGPRANANADPSGAYVGIESYCEAGTFPVRSFISRVSTFTRRMGPLATARNRPSGDQDSLLSRSVFLLSASDVITRSPPPCEEAITTFTPSLVLRRNANLSPPGDQHGEVSSAALFVILKGSVSSPIGLT